MANITTQTIRVDLSTGKVIPTAYTHQNDTARTLVFDMYNGGLPYTMTGNTVKFAYKSPVVDGQYSVIAGSSMANGDVDGNKVSVALPQAYTAISGVGMLTMIITPTSGTVRPVNIRLVVQKSADGANEIAGASDFPSTVEDVTREWLSENVTFNGMEVDLVPLFNSMVDKTNAGITYAHEDNVFTVSGTKTPSYVSFCNVIDLSIPNAFVKAGDTLGLKFKTTGQYAYLNCFAMSSGSILARKTVYNTDYVTTLTLPSGTDRFVARLQVGEPNVEVDETITFNIYNRDGFVFQDHFTAPDNGTDLNDLVETGAWLLVSDRTHPNTPPTYVKSDPQLLTVIDYSVVVEQTLTDWHHRYTYTRRRFNGIWTDWRQNDIRVMDNSLPSCDLNDVLRNSMYLLIDSATYTNLPSGERGIGFLITSHVYTAYLQMFIPFTPETIYMRRKLGSDDFTAWQKVSGGQSVTNEYTFNEYSSTNTITATPSITTDTNNFLQATGTTADVTASILSMLESTGYCKLGVGDFYVSNLDLPSGACLEGCGYKTRVILSGTGDGYAVKYNDYCTVKNLRLVGATNGITLSSTVGNRHGILFQGNYTSSKSSDEQPKMGLLDNLFITGFTGGGITCYDTGYGTYNHLSVCNVDIWNCNAGLNISYRSEFHKFTNVRARTCYYGLINNGGNNVFVNCDFSSCTKAMLMDNSQGQSPNNSHGSAIGCVFNHTDNNSGIGIDVQNCDNGFVFDGCQIFFSQINVVDSDGVSFTNCNFGNNNCNITVNGGGVVLFANNLHQAPPTISVTNNNNVHFVNCYVRSTGASVSN